MRLRTERLRVLVVDDDGPFRTYVCALLDERGYTAEPASCGSDALDSLVDAPPAAVILDVNMQGLSGYEVCRAIRDDLGLRVPVLLVSGERTESFDRVAGLTIGADDYLVKPFAPDELLARLRALLRRIPLEELDDPRLTPRELQVLRLLAEGVQQQGIARQLVISPKTVGTHIERILSKLGAHSRAEAVAIAYRLRLVAVPA
ncbi:MAG: response regulator transcription factor [Actinomycetota bacterium]|nr:response regulator transcription factor [Actinomycetota bacterium]